MIRQPFVAGQFYPDDPEELRRLVAKLAGRPVAPQKAIALVSPHAGYVYSGPVAAAVFASAALPKTLVILGPAHREIRPLFAIQSHGSWRTPLGESPVDAALAADIKRRCALVEDDERAHRFEHSLEVQLPFIQYFRPDAAIVPISVSYEAALTDLEALGLALAEAAREACRDVLFVASTDMSHYVSQKAAERLDRLAIDRILALDPAGLHETVVREQISMCGFQPTTAVLEAARSLGAKKAELVLYQTSGEASGDYAQVVGYAGVRIL